MAYTIADDVRTEAGFDQNANILDALVNGYITQATAEIDSTLAKRYSLPLSETPDIIEYICRQYAAGLLLKKEYGYDDDARTSGKVKMDNALRLLERVGSGDLLLLDSSSVEMTTTSTGSLTFNPTSSSDTERKFTMSQEF